MTTTTTSPAETSFGGVREIRLNAPVPGAPMKFFKQDRPANAEALFAMDLPAEIQRAGDIFSGGITPTGRIIVGDGAACVSASVLDEDALTRAAAELEARLGGGVMTGAALRLSSPDKSFAEIVGMADHGGCGCRCGCGAGALGELRLGATTGAHEAAGWSEAIPAKLVVKSGVEGISTTLFAQTTGFIVEACNSDWYWKGWFRSRFTLCEGECKGADLGKPCACGSPVGGNARLCSGWTDCDC
ncbi:MAG: hypothetical protein AAF360_11680 [Pseudomonadota bacterium]